MSIDKWVNKGEVPGYEAEATAALEALRPGECLTYDDGDCRVERHEGIGGFGLSDQTNGEWEGIDIGKSLASTIGDLRDDGVFEFSRGTFTVEIEPGNEAMRSRADVGDILRELGEKIDGDGWTGEGVIQDRNGNPVGRYTFHNHN